MPDIDHDGESHGDSEKKIIENMNKFKGKSQLKRSLVTTVVKQMSFDNTQNLRHEFDHFDTDGSGSLSRDEIKVMLQKILKGTFQNDEERT